MKDKLYDNEPEYSNNDHLYGQDEPTTSFGERLDAGTDSEFTDDALLDDSAQEESAGEGGILGGARSKLEDGFHEALGDSGSMEDQLTDGQLADEAGRDYQR